VFENRVLKRVFGPKREEVAGEPNILVVKPPLGRSGKIILERILGKQGERVWNGCICLRIGTSGGPL
jgi:hypothetical protein